jgi:ankyrin repeat protein
VDDRLNQLAQCIAKNDAFRVGALLSEDPDLVTSLDPEGRTPILLALYFRNEDLARLIWERNPAPNLFEAAAMGRTDLLGELMEEAPEGANSVAPDGFGILGLAVYFGRREAAEAILDAGADPDTPSANDFKVRPLHSAAAQRDEDASLDLVRLLLDRGANPNVAQAGGWTPLHQAAADPNVAQAGGWTPLHQAAAHGRREVAELLVAKGASLTAESDDGRTPLEMARVKGHTELEPLLGGTGS